MEAYVAIGTTFKPISEEYLQLSGLRLWHPSIKFDHEINLKVLMYLMLLD